MSAKRQLSKGIPFDSCGFLHDMTWIVLSRSKIWIYEAKTDSEISKFCKNIDLARQIETQNMRKMVLLRFWVCICCCPYARASCPQVIEKWGRDARVPGPPAGGGRQILRLCNYLRIGNDFQGAERFPGSLQLIEKPPHGGSGEWLARIFHTYS